MTKTAAEKREDEKARYNAFLAVCPSRALLERLSNKWVTLVLCALGGTHPGALDVPASPRELRYSQLSRQIAGVSPKMLTQTLRALERDGLVERTVIPTVPVTVTYALTDLGTSLHATVQPLKRWAEANMDAVQAHHGT